MNKLTNTPKQRGFFDLGISLVILLLGATTVAVTAPESTETSVAQVQTSMTQETTARENLASYDFEIDD